jgi:peptidoglycan/LPS O-acetylase OafA/YrhL
MKLMKLSIRIPLGLTIAVVAIGIIVFNKIDANTGALPMTPFILWIIASIILIAITIWSALGFKGISKRP